MRLTPLATLKGSPYVPGLVSARWPPTRDAMVLGPLPVSGRTIAGEIRARRSTADEPVEVASEEGRIAVLDIGPVSSVRC